MKKLIIIILMFGIFSSVTHAEKNILFSDFINSIESADKALYDKNFSCNDSKIWWDIDDKFVLSLFNEMLNVTSPFDYFKVYRDKEYKDRNIERIQISIGDGKSMGFSFWAPRPPNEEGQTFSIGITSLNPDNTVFFINYERLWNELPNCEGRLLQLGTFRILEKNKTTGKFEFIARQEDTNFYRQVISSGKFIYRDESAVLPCEWGPILKAEDINIDGNNLSISFKILYFIGRSGSTLQHKMYVSWIYGPDKKLQATQYVYQTHDERYDPNVKISDDIREGKPVKLAP